MGDHRLHAQIQVVTFEANGIRHRLRTNVDIPSSAELSRNDHDSQFPKHQRQHKHTLPHSQGTNPLILLLHGWPDSSFGWRHQLSLLAKLRIPVCAPDLRGFGGTNTIRSSLGGSMKQHDYHVEDFAVDVVACDMIQITAALGFETMVVVGHDFGAYLAWHLALLYPQQVVGVMALSIPYMGHVPVDQPPMAALQQRFGTCLPCQHEQEDGTTTEATRRTDQMKAKFHYVLHHNLPNAHEKYDVNIREALYRIYAYQKGVECEEHDNLLIQDDRMFIPPFFQDLEPQQQQQQHETPNAPLLDGRSAPALWQRIPFPKALPSWLSSTDVDIMVQDVLDSGGFASGLCWYRALDLNWHRTQHLRHTKVHQPSYFIIGDKDTIVINNHGGSLPRIQERMKQHVVNLQKCIVIPNAGHWLPLQCADMVNQELIHFLTMLKCYDPQEVSADKGDHSVLNRTIHRVLTSKL